GGPLGEVLVGYLGTTAADIETALLGTIVAPNATVELRRPGNNAPHQGAAFGKGVHVFSNATVLRLPFSWTFLCPAGDSDGDGVVDCVDACPADRNKVLPGLCGCNVPEIDADHDGIPRCIDFCDNDPANTLPGQCGCAGANPAPAGKTCTDSIASPGTAQTCNGAGVCGNPSAVAPAPTCFPRRFDGHIYWFCPTPVTWNQAE